MSDELDKLDARAAVEILGWFHHPDGGYGRDEEHVDWVDWAPTIRIEQAFMVLEKLPREKAFEVSIVRSFLGWRCNIYTQKEFEEDFGPGGHGKLVCEYYEDLAEAIVRACLKAVEGKGLKYGAEIVSTGKGCSALHAGDGQHLVKTLTTFRRQR